MPTIYPENIMRKLRQRLDLEPEDTSRDHEIDVMTPNEAFDAVLEWEGIIGYGEIIRGLIYDIYDKEVF